MNSCLSQLLSRLFMPVLLYFFLAADSSAQTWANTYGGNSNARDVVQCSDGGYIVAGRTSSFGAGSSDIWIVKLDATGIISWEKTYGGIGIDVVLSIATTADNGCIAAGATSSFGAGNNDFWILKLDSAGDIQWQKTYGTAGWEVPNSIKQVPDNGYIVAGYIDTGSGQDFWVLKLSDDGLLEWQKKYAGSGTECAYSVSITPDECYLVAGTGFDDFWVIKIDGSGSILWQKNYGGSGYETAYCGQNTSDGGYIVTGSTSSFGGVFRLWTLKLDSNGNVQWQKVYGNINYELARYISQTSDNGYILAGKSGSNIWILRLDSSGNIQWQKTYGGSMTEQSYSVKQTSDGGFIVAGETQSFGPSGLEAWILKLDISGSIDPSCSFINDTSGTITDSNATSVATASTASDTGITPQVTAAITSDSTATVTEQCSGSGCMYFLSVPAPVGVDTQTCNGTITTSDSTPELEWTNVSSESGYEWEVWTGSDCTGTLISTGSVSADVTSADVNVDLADGQYYWHVRALGDGETYCDSYWSGTCDFLVIGGGHWITWARAFGADTGAAYSVSATSDGGYSIAGRSDPSGTGNYDIRVMKVDIFGDAEWVKNYSGSLYEHSYTIEQTLDEGYILSGYTNSFAGNGYDAFLIKLNSSGIVEWQKIYGGINADAGYALVQTSEGGYIIAGETKSYGAGQADCWIIRLDSAGGILWQKAYGGSYDDILCSIRQTSDGGYIAAGLTYSYGSGAPASSDLWVLRLDSAGDVGWQKNYGGPGYDDAGCVLETPSGDFLVTGRSNSYSAGDYDLWILKLDSSGNIFWQKKYGGSGMDRANCASNTSDGGFVVAGYTDSFGAGGYDLWAMKIDSSGDVVWQKTYGGSNNDGALNLERTQDGGYIMSGWTWSFSSSNSDYWVLKINPYGEIGSSCEFITDTSVTVGDTPAVDFDTFVTPVISTAVPSNSGATVSSTGWSMIEQCSGCEITAPELLSIDGQSCSGPIETSDTTPELIWSDVEGEAGYNWQIGQGSDCSGPMVTGGTIGSDVTSVDVSPSLIEGTYYWRFQAAGDGLLTCDSDWVCGCPFTVTIPEPPAGDVYPFYILDKTGTFECAEVADADTYNIYEGSLGNWYSPDSTSCWVSGTLSSGRVTLEHNMLSGDHWYLIGVSNTGGEKASLGADSEGNERDDGSSLWRCGANP